MKKYLALAALLAALSQPAFAACPVCPQLNPCCPTGMAAPICQPVCPVAKPVYIPVAPVCEQPCPQTCNPCATGMAAPVGSAGPVYIVPERKKGFWSRFWGID